MKSIILAAGKGSRLKPLTLNTPKPLIKILGKSLVSRQINLIKSRGIDNINIIGGYLSDQFKNEEINLIVNSDYKKTNMVYSLFCAESILNEDVIVSYGDIAYSAEILDKLIESKNEISVVIDLEWSHYWGKRFTNPLEDLESLKMNAKSEIIDIGQKVNSIDEIQGQFIGLIKFSETGVQKMKNVYKELSYDGEIMSKSIKEAYMTDFLQEMINKGNKLNAIKIHDPWVEIDTISDFENLITQERLRMIDDKINFNIF